MEILIAETRRAIKSSKRDERFRGKTCFFLELSFCAGFGVLPFFQCSCRKFKQDFFSGSSPLSNKKNIALVIDRDDDDCARMVNDFSDFECVVQLIRIET